MNGNDEVFVTFDGQSGHALQADDVVTIERASRPLCLVRSAQRSYFDVLRQKLKWGRTVTNRVMGADHRSDP